MRIIAPSLRRLIKHLNKNDFLLDEREFYFQLESHPNYPYLIAIVDTLNFFKIKAEAIKLPNEHINLLSNNFLALLNDNENQNELKYIEIKNGKFVIDKNIITKDQFVQKWNNIVVLIEGLEIKNTSSSISINNSTFYQVLGLTLAGSILIYTYSSLWFLVFLIFPLLGFIISYEVINNNSQKNNTIFIKICKSSKKIDCSSVITSSKWKVLKKINFSDLSIVFFSIQLISFFIYSLLDNRNEYFVIQQIILYFSIPFLVLSIYYQKFVEKKWCLMCLSIISIIFIEIIFIFFMINPVGEINTSSILLFLMISFLAYVLWIVHKSFLVNLKEIRKNNILLNRFKRNFNFFKNNLAASDSFYKITSSLSTSYKANLQISLLTNLNCKYCKDSHLVVARIMEEFNDQVGINIIFKFDVENVTPGDEIISIYRNLITIYQTKSFDYFMLAIDDWFKSLNPKQWLTIYNQNILDNNKIDLILKKHWSWCLENRLNYTPAIFIGDKLLPNNYEVKDLLFFMPDLIYLANNKAI